MEKYKNRENIEIRLKERKLRSKGKNNKYIKLNIVKQGKKWNKEGSSDCRI